MFGLLAPLGIAAAKAVGVHLLPHLIPSLRKVPALNNLAGGSVNNVEGAVFGILGRSGGILTGFLVSFYFQNPTFHHGINICLGALKDSIL